MLRIGLKGRYALAVAFGLGLILALLWTGVRVQREGDLQMADIAAAEVRAVGVVGLEKRGRTIARLLSEALTNALYFDDLKAIGELTRPAIAQPDIEYVLVFDRQGRVLHDGTASIAGFGQPMVGPMAPAAAAAQQVLVQRSDEVVDVTEPIFLGGERLGGVRIGLSLRGYAEAAAQAESALLAKAEAVADARRDALLWPLAGLCVLIGFGLWLVAIKLVRPVRALAAHARALEEGRYLQRLDTDRTDEIGDLMRSMGALGASLAAHDRDVRRLAYIDSLTGLPNRLVLRETLARAMMVGRSSGAGLALLFIDLDDFKRINDTLGHDAGDEALGQLAKRLEQRLVAMREPSVPEVTGSSGDMVCRFGGDEFVALLFGGDLRERARRFADGVFEAVRMPLVAAGRAVHLNASIGITLFPDDGDDPQQLLKSGDIAMYQAKLAGKNCYRFFTAAMTREAEERVQIEHDLREAMAAGTLEVHYQPIIDLRSERISGAEALLRWTHPQRGLVSTSLFVSIAEDFGLIQELGRFVLDRACADAVRWPTGGDPLFVSVNLSVRQLRDAGLPAQVAATLSRHGLPAARLHVELTESALLDSEPLALSALAELRRMGVRIWLDDFGTGFSGLSHLRRVPVDGVKIDRSFVQDLLTDRDDLALTSAIIAMAGSLGIETVAEGVESAPQLEVLRNLRCDLGQGFHLGHPMPASALLARLAAAPVAD
jgi:diguanylate cyclase (GGDEF)-like protein